MSARGIILLVCGVFLLIACNSEQDSNVLSKEKLAEVYSDIVFAKELYSGNPPKYTAVRDSLLVAHGTDTSEIRISFSYYSDDPDALDEIYQMAMERAEKRSDIDTVTVRPDTLAPETDTSGF